MIPSNFISTEVQNVPITITAEQATLLAAQLQGQSAVLQVNNPVQINPDQAYMVSVNGELHYPVPTSNVPGAPLALVPLGQHVNMDWLSMQTAQAPQQQFIQQEVQVAYQIAPDNISFVQEVPVASSSNPVQDPRPPPNPQPRSSRSTSTKEASGSSNINHDKDTKLQNPPKSTRSIAKENPSNFTAAQDAKHTQTPTRNPKNAVQDPTPTQTPSTRSSKKSKSPQKSIPQSPVPGPSSSVQFSVKAEVEDPVERNTKEDEVDESNSPMECDPSEERFASKGSPDLEDDEEAKALADEISGIYEKIT